MSRVKFTEEYIFNTTSKSLYTFISTPNGLALWFAENVTQDSSTDDFYTVWWGKTTAIIKILSVNDNVSIRYCWEEDLGSDYYFELTVKQDELTRVTSLTVVDFAEEGELEDIESIWNLNIKHLKKALGSK